MRHRRTPRRRAERQSRSRAGQGRRDRERLLCAIRQVGGKQDRRERRSLGLGRASVPVSADRLQINTGQAHVGPPIGRAPRAGRARRPTCPHSPSRSGRNGNRSATRGICSQANPSVTRHSSVGIAHRPRPCSSTVPHRPARRAAGARLVEPAAYSGGSTTCERDQVGRPRHGQVAGQGDRRPRSLRNNRWETGSTRGETWLDPQERSGRGGWEFDPSHRRSVWVIDLGRSRPDRGSRRPARGRPGQDVLGHAPEEEPAQSVRPWEPMTIRPLSSSPALRRIRLGGIALPEPALDGILQVRPVNPPAHRLQFLAGDTQVHRDGHLLNVHVERGDVEEDEPGPEVPAASRERPGGPPPRAPRNP